MLAGLFFLDTLLSGRWTNLLWNLGFAALLFAIMLHYYSMKLIGGGDLKLLTVSFLWVGPFCAPLFAIFLVVFIGIHITAAKFKWAEVRVVDGRNWIAFAPSIAAALICVFMTGCLRPL